MTKSWTDASEVGKVDCGFAQPAGCHMDPSDHPKSVAMSLAWWQNPGRVTNDLMCHAWGGEPLPTRTGGGSCLQQQ